MVAPSPPPYEKKELFGGHSPAKPPHLSNYKIEKRVMDVLAVSGGLE